MKKFGIMSVLTAGILWGSMGLFVRILTNDFGFTSFQVVTLRLTVAAVCFLILSFIKGIKILKVKISHLPILFCAGFFGIFSLSATYFLSIKHSSLSLAAILMYTAPIFVMIASLFLFKEKMTFLKTLSLVFATAGLVCVSGIFEGDAGVTVPGIIFGLLSGLTYGSYSIFGKYALRHYKSYTVTAWAFIFAGLSSLFVGNIGDMYHKICTNISPSFILLIVSMGIITAFLPFLFYTIGLSKLNASKAIILASVEPLIATIFGITVFKEPTDIISIIGIFTILAAVVMASAKKDT